MVAPLVTALGRTVTKKASSTTAERVVERNMREYARSRSNQKGEKPSVMLYAVVGLFALFKDMTDLMFGLLPGVGMVVALIFGFCCSTMIFFLLTALDRSGDFQSAQAFIRRIATLLGATVVDIIPLISFLPVTTLSVMFLYACARHEWKKGNRSLSPTPTYA